MMFESLREGQFLWRRIARIWRVQQSRKSCCHVLMGL